jgi:hypothetical protein
LNFVATLEATFEMRLGRRCIIYDALKSILPYNTEVKFKEEVVEIRFADKKTESPFLEIMNRRLSALLAEKCPS